MSRFLDDPEFVSVTITIRFTDDGLSLARRDVGYDMGFFTHPRRDPAEDDTILSLFGSIGVQRGWTTCAMGAVRARSPFPSRATVIRLSTVSPSADGDLRDAAGRSCSASAALRQTPRCVSRVC